MPRDRIHFLDDLLRHQPVCRRIEIDLFDRGGLVEQRASFELRGKECRALSGVFGRKVTRDSAAFVQNETAIVLILIIGQSRSDRQRMARPWTYNVGHLAERLLRQKLRRFVLALHDVDGDEREGDVLFFQHNGYTLGAGGERRSVESQHHIVIRMKQVFRGLECGLRDERWGKLSKLGASFKETHLPLPLGTREKPEPHE